MRDYVKPSKSVRKLIVQRRKALRYVPVSRVVAVRRPNGQSEKYAIR